MRLHGLRHSHASHLLAENVHPKIMQERLGHHSISVTMDIYSHLMPNMQAEAAAKLDAVLGAAKKPSLRTNRAQIARQMVANGILAGEKAR